MTEKPPRCIAPGTVRPDDLVMFALGEADAGTASHIAECPRCGPDARAYTEMAGQVRAHRFRSTCPDSIELGEYALGILPAATMQSVAAHMIDCPHCLAESRSLAAFVAEPEPAPRRTSLGAALRRLVALPSAPPPLAGALRGVPSTERVLWQAEGIRFAIDARREGVGRSISLVAEAGINAPENVRVLLSRGWEVVAEVLMDDLGFATFAAVPPGSYQIDLVLPDTSVVEIGPLELA